MTQSQNQEISSIKGNTNGKTLKQVLTIFIVLFIPLVVFSVVAKFAATSSVASGIAIIVYFVCAVIGICQFISLTRRVLKKKGLKSREVRTVVVGFMVSFLATLCPPEAYSQSDSDCLTIGTASQKEQVVQITPTPRSPVAPTDFIDYWSNTLDHIEFVNLKEVGTTNIIKVSVKSARKTFDMEGTPMLFMDSWMYYVGTTEVPGQFILTRADGRQFLTDDNEQNVTLLGLCALIAVGGAVVILIGIGGCKAYRCGKTIISNWNCKIGSNLASYVVAPEVPIASSSVASPFSIPAPQGMTISLTGMDDSNDCESPTFTMTNVASGKADLNGNPFSELWTEEIRGSNIRLSTADGTVVQGCLFEGTSPDSLVTVDLNELIQRTKTWVSYADKKPQALLVTVEWRGVTCATSYVALASSSDTNVYCPVSETVVHGWPVDPSASSKFWSVRPVP